MKNKFEIEFECNNIEEVALALADCITVADYIKNYSVLPEGYMPLLDEGIENITEVLQDLQDNIEKNQKV